MRPDGAGRRRTAADGMDCEATEDSSGEPHLLIVIGCPGCAMPSLSKTTRGRHGWPLSRRPVWDGGRPAAGRPPTLLFGRLETDCPAHGSAGIHRLALAYCET